MNDHIPTTVGVDISKAHLDAHELPTGRAARFNNDAAGITKLSRWVSPDVDRVVYESTGSCHRAFEEALAGTLPLARVNAARARRFAQAMGQEAKTDAADAMVLARMGAAVDLRPVDLPSPALRDLAELRTAHDGLTRDRTAVLEPAEPGVPSARQAPTQAAAGADPTADQGLGRGDRQVDRGRRRVVSPSRNT